MIQDIQPDVFNNEYIPRAPRNHDYVLYFLAGKKVLVRNDQKTIRFPTVKELFDPAGDQLQYLFSISGKRFYLASRCELPEPAGWHYESFMQLNREEPAVYRFAAATGYHLFNWYRRNRFCGCCGTEMRPVQQLRALQCPACGDMVFPRLDPAVIAAVVDGKKDKILVTRYRGRAFKGAALIAGFCEIGETVEDTVRREVMEEAGICVGRMQYYKSQPWGQDANLLVGFFVEADSTQSIHRDREELSAAAWVDRDAIPRDYSPVSLTGEMMEYFRDHGSPFSR